MAKTETQSNNGIAIPAVDVKPIVCELPLSLLDTMFTANKLYSQYNEAYSKIIDATNGTAITNLTNAIAQIKAELDGTSKDGSTGHARTGLRAAKDLAHSELIAATQNAATEPDKLMRVSAAYGAAHIAVSAKEIELRRAETDYCKINPINDRQLAAYLQRASEYVLVNLQKQVADFVGDPASRELVKTVNNSSRNAILATSANIKANKQFAVPMEITLMQNNDSAEAYVINRKKLLPTDTSFRAGRTSWPKLFAGDVSLTAQYDEEDNEPETENVPAKEGELATA